MVGVGRLDRVAQRWRLRIGERLNGGSRSEVLFLLRPDLPWLPPAAPPV